MKRYDQLLATLDLGFVRLRNRIVMGSMHTRLETAGQAAERMAAFYRERARGEAGLILTGGHSPNQDGRMDEDGPMLTSHDQLDLHRAVTAAVHEEGGLIALQILHAGRYAKHAHCVAPSMLRSPINRFAPRALETEQVWATVDDFARTAALAREAGYDGVEIMGSEGYLITQFLCERTNRRDDAFGGSFESRMRFPLEIVKAIRARVGDGFLLIYRISAADLVEGGLTGAEVAELARRLEQAGVHILNTGIGWHEATVPTIAAAVPRGAWRYAIENVKRAVRIPVIASTRINTPDLAESLLADGVADLISMARPLLADPEFARKVRDGIPERITPCVACNQACLDHIFTKRTATCLVNPRAGHEREFAARPTSKRKSIAVVGAGAAGIYFALNAASRGHAVTLYEAGTEIGGQLLMAGAIPGKSEFGELIRHLRARLAAEPLETRLGHRVQAAELVAHGYDEVVLATGVRPRLPDIPGIDHSSVLTYLDVLAHRVPVGQRVAIIGAGGIGFDTAHFLLDEHDESISPARFFEAWGIDPELATPGGLRTPSPRAACTREIHIFQRSLDKPGARLGKSTGWILKAGLQRGGVTVVTGVAYTRIDDDGFHYVVDGRPMVLKVDNVIICAGQEPERSLYQQLVGHGVRPHLLGGADSSAELDAFRAIRQATALAMTM